MATIKYIDDEDVWDVLWRYLFPAGIPPAWPATTRFIGGYPTGHRNPYDDGVERLELHWDHDFTPEEEEAWRRLIRKCRRKARDESDDHDRLLDAQVNVLSQWKNRTGSATNAQRDAVLDAMMNLWRLELRDED